MPLTIDRLMKSVPLYVQIADSLVSQIESGELAPGARLPSERELSETLSVQRETVRQALAMLEHQGLLQRRQGSGTFIAEPKIERDAGRLFPFSKAMQGKGFKPGARVIALERIRSNQSVAHELDIPLSAPIFHIQRLRTINQEPVVIENTFLPATLFPDLDTHDLNNQSLYEILETHYGARVSQARQSLEAVVASDFEARLLGLKEGDPMMLERRLTFDQFSRRVEYSKDLFRGDRFRFTTERTPLEN